MPRSIVPGGFHSFWDILKDYLNLIPWEAEILEWGPGDSTQLMLDERPAAMITTYEHDPHWFQVAKKRFCHEENITLRYRTLESNYHTHPLTMDRKFDLIFIDGRNRVKCCMTAEKLVADHGYVLLHDANREEYRNGVRLFEVIKIESDTAVMRKKK